MQINPIDVLSVDIFKYTLGISKQQILKPTIDFKQSFEYPPINHDGKISIYT